MVKPQTYSTQKEVRSGRRAFRRADLLIMYEILKTLSSYGILVGLFVLCVPQYSNIDLRIEEELLVQQYNSILYCFPSSSKKGAGTIPT